VTDSNDVGIDADAALEISEQTEIDVVLGGRTGKNMRPLFWHHGKRKGARWVSMAVVSLPSGLTDSSRRWRQRRSDGHGQG